MNVKFFLVCAFWVPALAINICQYQAPTTNLLRGEAALSYHYFEDPLTPGPDINSGKFAFRGDWLVDSPERGVGLSFGGELALAGLSPASFTAQVSGTFREYPFPALSYFVFGGVEGMLDAKYTRPLLEARAGVGYGRFTDVTPLVRALRVEERLLQEGLLLSALPERVILRLAQEIGRRQLYPALSDLAAALVKIITEETKTSMDPRGALIAEEVLEEAGLERYCGWTAQFGLGYALSRPQPGYALAFNFSLQAAATPDPRTQILFKSDLSAPYQVFEEYTWNLSASYTYRVNEVTNFAANYSLRQVKPRGQMPAGTQSATFQLVFKLGGANVTIQVAFSKLAEAREWAQDLLISAGWQLW